MVFVAGQIHAAKASNAAPTSAFARMAWRARTAVFARLQVAILKTVDSWSSSREKGPRSPRRGQETNMLKNFTLAVALCATVAGCNKKQEEIPGQPLEQQGQAVPQQQQAQPTAEGMNQGQPAQGAAVEGA